MADCIPSLEMPDNGVFQLSNCVELCSTKQRTSLGLLLCYFIILLLLLLLMTTLQCWCLTSARHLDSVAFKQHVHISDLK